MCVRVGGSSPIQAQPTYTSQWHNIFVSLAGRSGRRRAEYKVLGPVEVTVTLRYITLPCVASR